MNEKIESMKSKGVPIAKVWFNEAVRNENHFGVDETHVGRKATMTLTPLGLFIEQPGKKLAIVPFDGNVKWCEIL